MDLEADKQSRQTSREIRLVCGKDISQTSTNYQASYIHTLGPRSKIRIPDVHQGRCTDPQSDQRGAHEHGSQSHSTFDGFSQAQTDGEEKCDYFWTPHLFLAEKYICQTHRASKSAAHLVQTIARRLHQQPRQPVRTGSISLAENNY
jgi:hypothetical protein